MRIYVSFSSELLHEPYQSTRMKKWNADSQIDTQINAAAQDYGQGPSFIDTQFAIFYNTHSYSYTATLRPVEASQQHHQSTTRFSTSSFTTQPSQIPLLTLDGLIIWFTSKILSQPQATFISMNQILSTTLLSHPTSGYRLQPFSRRQFPKGEDTAEVNRLKLCMDAYTQRIADAKNLEQISRNSVGSVARTRDDGGWLHSDRNIRNDAVW
jgi:hypothetical protein